MNYFFSKAASLRGVLGVRGAFSPRRVHGNVTVTALRAGACMALPLLLLHALGRVDLAPYAAMGCFTALYARDDTYARRARVLALVGAALTLAVAVGGLASALFSHTLAAVLAGSLVAAGAKYLSDALAFGAPAGLMFVFATGVAAYNPQTLAALPLEVAVTAAAAALCWAAAVAGALVHPTAPERLAVSRALHALARHLDGPTDATRAGAEAAVQHAWTTLLRRPRPARPRSASALESLELLTARAESLLGGTGEALGDARTAAEMSELARRTRRERGVRPLVGGRERAALAAHAEHLRRQGDPEPGTAERLRGALRSPSPTPVSVARVGAASLLAGALAWAAGMDHGYWAAVSAGSVLQAADVTTTWHRTLQRALGTLAGVALAAVLFSFDYSPLGVIALVVLCQMAAEMVVAANYSYAIVFVTPLTLALSGLAHPAGATPDLAAERLWATVLGAVVGIAVCAVLANRRADEHLQAALAEGERARLALERRGADHPAARRGLARALVALREAHALASGEPGTRAVARTGEVEDLHRRARALLDAPRGG
ncbi:FUSC family protein [Nocardiopsis sp. NPDC101807]|uniref:FUSC family protein n=1 Tax=Nocardiopsis sp. NPDC101807 TaxID=3364339 RepID=UPI00382B63EC